MIRRDLLALALLALPVQGLRPTGAEAQVAADRPARAQGVAGRVTEAGTGAPVEGAFVTLVDEDGTRHGGALSRDDGRFTVAAVPGRYHLRVERIGYGSVDSEPFPIAAGETVRRDVRVPTQAISLEGIRVEGERRCDLGAAEGAAAALLWEEARKALSVATWAEDTGFRYQVTTFTRPVGLAGRLDENPSEERTAWVGETFRSLDANTLAARGYVLRDGDRHVYYGPDARVLLSDTFLETHCFRAEREDGRVGLAFEPAPDRSLPDVEGTLWFDADGSALEEVEFRYTGLRPGTNHRTAGGRVRFERLPGGAWIVREWTLRMPVLGEERGFGGVVETRVVGFVEQGGRVTDLRPAAPGEAGAGEDFPSGVAPEDVPPEASPAAAARIRCAAAGGREAAAVAGWTRGPDAGAAVPGTGVEVRWAGTDAWAPADPADPAAVPRDRGLRVSSDAAGRFVACRVPAGRALRVRVLSGTSEGGWVEVAPLEPGAVGRVDLTVPAGRGGRPSSGGG